MIAAEIKRTRIISHASWKNRHDLFSCILNSIIIFADQSTMILIIGLGNPDEKYRNTRHNIGREIVAALRTDAKLPEFERRPRWNALIAEGKIGKEKTALLLPDTTMNRSGAAAAPAARYYKIKPKDVFVVHDDADLPLGRAKLSFGKHSAGHRGVESVIRALKTRDFWRFRIGIAGRRDIPAERLVLKKFTPAESPFMKKVIKRTVDALLLAAAESPEKAMNEYNRN